MGFLNIELGQYANVSFFEKIKNNFEFFKEKFVGKKYDEFLSAYYNLDIFETPTYDTDLREIRDLFNKVEEHTFVFDSISDWINEYSYYIDYGEQDPTHWRIWEYKQSDKYALVKRWIDWMNYTNLIVSDQEQKKQYLRVEHNIDKSEIISYDYLYDENGEQIITLEGYFSEGRTNNI